MLTDITVEIGAGEQVGLVGKTGAGKTTLVDLLLRTYNVEDGMILLDGKDINSLNIESVRNAFAYVPHDNFLFSDTIARNIAFGNNGDVSNMEKIELAARMADVNDNIREFASGYETVLGEREA